KRRLHARRTQRELSNAALRLSKLARARGALRHVRLDRLLLLAFQRAQRVEIEIFFASWMSVHAVSGCRFRFNVSIADRRRVFTVPRDSPISRGVPLCVMP